MKQYLPLLRRGYILRLLLLASLLLPGLVACRQELHERELPDPSVHACRALQSAFDYAGQDSLILSVITQLKASPKVVDFVAQLEQEQLTPLWNHAIHIGWVNRQERLFVPVYKQGEEKITRIWVLYADHGDGLIAEYMLRGESFEEHEWLYDYLTYEALGKIPASGIIYRSSPTPRMRIDSDGVFIYRCTVGYGAVGYGAPLKQISEERCIPIGEIPRLRAPALGGGSRGGGGAGGGVGGGGYVGGYGGRVINGLYNQYTCFFWDRRGPVPNPPRDSLRRHGPPLPPTPPPPPPPDTTRACNKFVLKIQRPDIRALLDEFHRSVQKPGGNEQGCLDMADGSLKRLPGKYAHVDIPKDISLNSYLGAIHTHPYEDVDDEDAMLQYNGQIFSGNDIEEYIKRTNRTIGGWLQQGKPGDQFDLSNLYTGVVTRRGLYVLTMDRQLSYEELLELHKQFSTIPADMLEASWKEAKNDQEKWYLERSYDLKDHILELSDMPSLEEQKLLQLINDYYTIGDYHPTLLFLDLSGHTTPKAKNLKLDEGNRLKEYPCK